jgi:hypothetical protein
MIIHYRHVISLKTERSQKKNRRKQKKKARSRGQNPHAGLSGPIPWLGIVNTAISVGLDEKPKRQK